MKLEMYSGNSLVYKHSSNLAEFINSTINTVYNIHSIFQLFDSVFITGYKESVLKILSGVDTVRYVTPRGCWNICGADKGILGKGSRGAVELEAEAGK